jgi:hypothetical protein
LKDLQIEDNDPQRMKFVDYFNEFRKEVFWERSPFEYENRFDNVHIISKNMWFIKRLVEKDKIEREKFWNSETKSSKYSDFELSYDTPREDYKNILLMELAIQDDPITFILKILK